jgi:hypothetical protein
METFSNCANDVGNCKREPLSSNKGSEPQAKRNKHSFKSQNPRPLALEPLFKVMDPEDPSLAHRIAQRRKAIAKGKNSHGYIEYIKRVPKASRLPRSIATPSTPDPCLHMSNSRFNGLVRAWLVNCGSPTSAIPWSMVISHRSLSYLQAYCSSQI